jgi:hypothetical protein
MIFINKLLQSHGDIKIKNEMSVYHKLVIKLLKDWAMKFVKPRHFLIVSVPRQKSRHALVS